MKILLVVHQFFPQYTSGTEVLTYSVARELLSRQHEVRILTAAPSKQHLTDEQRCDEYRFEAIPVYRFHHDYTAMANQTSMLELDYDNHLAANYFAKILQNFQPDLVHFFHLSRLGTGLIDQSVQQKIPAFMTPTDFWAICTTAQMVLPNGDLCKGPSCYSGNCVKHFVQLTRKGLLAKLVSTLPVNLIDSLVKLTQNSILPTYQQQEVKAASNRLTVNIKRLNQLNRIISPTRLVTERLIHYGITPERITQSSFGINVNTATKQRPTYQTPLKIGFIGTLAPHKGCHILIEAVKKLDLNQAILNIYGNLTDFPDYANTLQQSVISYDNIHFCGTFPNEHIADIFAQLDVLVVPSLWYENTPLVLYSAQAAHCPVIASDFAGLSDVIEHEENGLLFKPGDGLALAEQLKRLINNPNLLKHLSSNAKTPKSIASYVDELLTIWQNQD